MIFFTAIKSATFRPLKSWKGVFFVWFSSLFLVSMLALPMKSTLKSGFGRSMITEKLANGIDFEVLADLGAVLRSLSSFFSAGFLLILLTGILLNAFFTGGLFSTLRASTGRFSGGDFFSFSAKNFFPFLIISMLVGLMILFLLILVVGIPLALAGQSGNAAEGAVMRVGIVASIVFFLLMTILLLVADYARAWQVTKEKNLCFQAIGFGFAQTFRTFLSSYPMMLIILVVQLLFGWLVFKIIPGMNPVSGGGVFLLFILTQILFFIKLLLKTWRYACVTSLMEADMNVEPASADPVVSGNMQFNEMS